MTSIIAVLDEHSSDREILLDYIGRDETADDERVSGVLERHGWRRIPAGWRHEERKLLGSPVSAAKFTLRWMAGLMRIDGVSVSGELWRKP